MAFRSAAYAGSDSGGDLTATPAGVQVNDYLGGLGVTDLSGDPVTNATGWTERANIDQGTPDSNSGRYLDKIAAGGDDFTWTFPANEGAMTVGAWSGRNTSAPRTATQTTINTSANATPVSASFTGVTAVNGDDIAVFMETDETVVGNDWNYSTITNYTERIDDTSISFITLGLQTRDNVSAGATGSLATTITRTVGSGDTGYAGIVVAIANAPGGDAVLRSSLFTILVAA